jgi:hypothetical protein
MLRAMQNAEIISCVHVLLIIYKVLNSKEHTSSASDRISKLSSSRQPKVAMWQYKSQQAAVAPIAMPVGVLGCS